MDKILIVDDNPTVCTALELLLSIHDFDSISCYTPAEAMSIVQKQPIGLVIQDMNFTQDTTSGEEGKALYYQLRQLQPDLPIILLTAWTQLEMAVELVRAGAADYLGKPWDDNKLMISVKNLLEMADLRKQNQRMHLQNQRAREAVSGYDLCGLIYQSSAMQTLIEMSVQVAHSDIAALITGPNGAGKEKIAEIIQANSNRKNQPFVKVNVGALPSELLEAELFGAEAGAFTGAGKARIGRFEAADGGTLFLDEIGNLPLAGQVKLLRVLQTGEFERLGSAQTRKVNVRIISATNANLRDDIATGTFREDLFYRLNVIELKLAPLNQRPDDIMPLAQHFAGSQFQLSHDLEAVLLSHDWSGNVRELENAVKRATVLAKSAKLTIEDFGLSHVIPTKAVKTFVDPDKDDILQAINQADGVIARAAKSLGLSRQAFYRRMDKHGISR
ncbi:MAG: sigma-54-dependent Fis family transcriptional regulator [Algicola sp.]|nr:sigma-54-dependent Fis family transcriptional regulator [Algicola sp.]